MTANDTAHLLVVSHTPSENTRRLTQAVLDGARHPDVEGVKTRLLAPLDAGPDDVLNCQAIILGTTENFGYMSGALKDFFERIYYPCLERTQGLPYALFIRAGNDGAGAHTSIDRIVTGLSWRQVQPPLIMQGDYRDVFVEQCATLGTTVAAGLEMGVL